MFKKKSEAEEAKSEEKVEELEIEDEDEDEVEESEEPATKSSKKVEAPKINLTAEEVIAGIEFNINRAVRLLQLLK